MKPFYESNGVTIFLGDCREIMQQLEPVHAIITDPPYGFEFMGKEWDAPWKTDRRQNFDGTLDDHRENPYGRSKVRNGSGASYGADARVMQALQDWHYSWALECLRVLKPGGHMLAFGGSRTYHRLACAVEDAGFEVRDQIAYFYSSDVDRNEFLNSLTPEQQESFLKAFGRVSSVDWCYGSGFPKSLSVAKATQPKIESRYGKSTCSCMDSRNGQSTGNDGGCRSGQEIRLQRATSITSPQETGDSVLPLDTERCADSLRDLRDSGDSKAQGYAEIEAPFLLKGLCERGTETAGLGSVEIWAGVEEQKGGNSRTGQSVPDVREDASGKRIGTSCTSSETISLQRDESSEKSSSSVRLVPSQDRERNRASSILDPNRREPRRVVSDDHCGWSSAVAHVCSWCGLPSKEWLNAISLLGTALKPAHEPICVARKPLGGTVAANVQKHGAGALNIDRCRIEGEVANCTQGQSANAGTIYGADQREQREFIPSALGRWPANVIHDGSEEVVSLFPQVQSGSIEPHHIRRTSKTVNVYGERDAPKEEQTYGDNGSAARFFYTAKASQDERGTGNNHPTVKPLDLMRYLCKLLCPPREGILLDPFMGSGSTIIAGRRFYKHCIGIELEEKYAEIAAKRLSQEMFTFEVRE